ncbi:hypothetical protein SEVIR_2G009301v4 [Setaria viridis]
MLTVPFLTITMAACSWRRTAGWPGCSPQPRQAPAQPRSLTWSRAPSTAAQPHPRVTANLMFAWMGVQQRGTSKQRLAWLQEQGRKKGCSRGQGQRRTVSRWRVD